MARRKTVAELESEIARLQPYQEALFCLAGAVSDAVEASGIRIHSGEHTFFLIGASRAAGGVIVTVDPTILGYACDVAQRWEASGDPYLRDCAGQVRRAQKQAAERRATCRECVAVARGVK